MLADFVRFIVRLRRYSHQAHGATLRDRIFFVRLCCVVLVHCRVSFRCVDTFQDSQKNGAENNYFAANEINELAVPALVEIGLVEIKTRKKSITGSKACR